MRLRVYRRGYRRAKCEGLVRYNILGTLSSTVEQYFEYFLLVRIWLMKLRERVGSL